MRRRRLGLLALACLVAPATFAAAQNAPQKAPGAGYNFPQKFGQAELVGTQDFEAQTPGLGQVGQYKFQGWRMSVYVYDKQRKDLADTARADQSIPELDEAVKDVHAAQKQGHYLKVEDGTAFAIPPIPNAGTFYCRSLKITAKPKDNTQPRPEDTYESYRCVSTSRKKFVKLILSSETPWGNPATVFTPVAASIELFGRIMQR